ncbi:MAG: hypothetical protein WCV67_15700 [Victivallaceae bacterium]|jgi:hypothetical protein
MLSLLKKIRVMLQTDDRSRQGQIIAEYVIMLAMCAIIAISLLVLMFYFSEYGWRVINLVSIDYP